MGKIPSNAEEQAKQDAKSCLREYLEGKGIDTGKPFRCMNPAHLDTSPSMKFSSGRNKAHCYSCGADYDTIDIIGIDYGLSGRSLFLKAYEIFGLDPYSGKINGRQKKIQLPTQSLAEVNEEAQEEDLSAFFEEAHMNLGKTGYLQMRGISEEAATRFRLGYVESWRHPKAPNSVPASPRLIIPTSNCSYLARDTRDALTDAEKKHAKSKVGKIHAFNAEALWGQRPVFVTEGEIDALSFVSIGLEAVAIGSASGIRGFVSLLTGRLPLAPLILALDSDAAGAKASKQLEDSLTSLGISFFKESPYGSFKDANEALVESRADFIAAAKDAEARAAGLDKTAVFAEANPFYETPGGKDAYMKASAAVYARSLMRSIEEGTYASCIPTGFSKLDKALDGGLREGLYTLGAVSSIGKTTLAMQIADQVAQQGTDAVVFSLEMARSELIAKSISRLTAASSFDGSSAPKTFSEILWHKSFDAESKALIARCAAEYEAYAKSIYIFEGEADTGAVQIRQAAQRHIAMTGNAPVVVVDYLQILSPLMPRGSDKQNVDYSVLELKRLSRDLKLPVIAISSFNRQNYSSPASMESFKESGAVEYSSDVLLGMQLAGVGKPGFDIAAEKQKSPRDVELCILKNRNGQAGIALGYSYYAAYSCFVEK